jgi:hypothetical protein
LPALITPTDVLCIYICPPLAPFSSWFGNKRTKRLQIIQGNAGYGVQFRFIAEVKSLANKSCSKTHRQDLSAQNVQKFNGQVLMDGLARQVF